MLLTLLAVVTIAIARQRNLFGVVILAGVYSFLMASVLIVLDAVDVAMTEASVGAGVSTVLLLGDPVSDQDHRDALRSGAPAPLSVSVGTGASGLGHVRIAPVCAPDAAIHTHVVPRYLADTIKETGFRTS